MPSDEWCKWDEWAHKQGVAARLFRSSANHRQEIIDEQTQRVLDLEGALKNEKVAAEIVQRHQRDTIREQAEALRKANKALAEARQLISQYFLWSDGYDDDTRAWLNTYSILIKKENSNES